MYNIIPLRRTVGDRLLPGMFVPALWSRLPCIGGVLRSALPPRAGFETRGFYIPGDKRYSSDSFVMESQIGPGFGVLVLTLALAMRKFVE